MLSSEEHTNPAVMSEEQLAHLGDGQVAYVRPILSEDVSRLFPQAPTLQAGVQLFALLGADGSPILLTDSRDVALANAMEHKLQTLSLH